MATAGDVNQKLYNDLATKENIGATPDLTTRLARRLAQDRQLGATTTVPLYDGDDVLDELRTDLNGLADF